MARLLPILTVVIALALCYASSKNVNNVKNVNSVKKEKGNSRSQKPILVLGPFSRYRDFCYQDKTIVIYFGKDNTFLIF